jgi:nicotinamide-nucleotide amidase
MTAVILSVGTELLLGDIVDTNASFISRGLASIGVSVYEKGVVGDNPARLTAALRRVFETAELVIATGGLGPTEDDITKEVAAAYFNLPLVYHAPTWEAILRRFKAAHLPSNNKKQAMVPEGARVFENANGTAPGICITQNAKTLILLPGPPFEMEPMFLNQALPYLQSQTDRVFVSRNLKIIGVGESRAEEMLGDLIHIQSNPSLALYAKTYEVWLRITASALDEKEAQALIEPMARQAYEIFGAHIYGEDGETLERVVVEMLKRNHHTLAVAESCTGGLLMAALTNVPGVSAVLAGGVVAYSNAVKINELRVSPETLHTYGAVSRETAAEMAERVAELMQTTCGVSITGIAGPDGGTQDKPVGLVYVGIAIKNNATEVIEFRLPPGRDTVRRRAAAQALAFIRTQIMNTEAHGNG